MSGDFPQVSWSRHQVVPVKVFVVSEGGEEAQGIGHQRAGKWAQGSGSASGETSLENKRNGELSGMKRENGGESQGSMVHVDMENGHFENGMTSLPTGKQRLPKQGRGQNGGLEYLRAQEKKVVRKTKTGEGDGGKAQSNGGRDGHVVIEIPNLPDPVFRADDYVPRYVHAYLSLMYVTCLSPYAPDKKDIKDHSNGEFAVWLIQKVIFSYFAIMSTLMSISYAKYNVLDFINTRKFTDLIDTGFFLFIGLVQISFTYFLAFQQNRISKMLRGWENHESILRNGETSMKAKKMSYWLAIVYGILSMIFSVTKTIFAQGIQNWSHEELILENSQSVAAGLFIWTSNAIQNTTELDKAYGENLTCITYTMGIKGIIAKIIWNLQIDCFRDLILFAVTVNKKQLKGLGRKLLDCLAFKKTGPPENRQLEEDLNCWNMYCDTREINMMTNDIFHHLLALNHVISLMTFTYFWALLLDKDVKMISLVFCGSNLVKIMYTLGCPCLQCKHIR